MNKRFFTGLVLACAFILPMAVRAADVAPVDLNFTKAGGGKFIYCNNTEAIMISSLTDDTNPNPEYLMSNPDLEPDKYTIYASHINHTEMKDGSGALASPIGFDVELDVEFKAKADTILKITAAGMETGGYVSFYDQGSWTNQEIDWGCLQGVSDYLQRPLRQLRSDKIWTPRTFREAEVYIKAGETYWLSQAMDAYDAVPWLKPVNLMADFEIVSGSADVNIAAMKSNGSLKERSQHNPNAAPGKYYRDRMHKGIADSLPQVSCPMNYTITDATASGTYLPVTVYNQFVPGGNAATQWVTHLNPQTDRWSKPLCAESDLLGFSYFDESKKTYYGKNVPEEEQDAVWRFDPFHSDTHHYLPALGGDPENYQPNYLLTTEGQNDAYGCHLGNYGVQTDYEITIDNQSGKTRYFNYILTTESNNLVSLKNSDGSYIGDFSLLKGVSKADPPEDTMACVELPAGEKTSFILEVILPVNYNGGMKNSFVITDQKTEVNQFSYDIIYRAQPLRFTGGEHYKLENGSIMTSEDGEAGWIAHPLSQETKDAFEGHWDRLKILKTDAGYVAKSVESPTYSTGYFQRDKERFYSLFYLDQNFNLTGRHTFEEFPSDFGYALGYYLVKTEKGNFYSGNGQKWNALPAGDSLPVSPLGSDVAVVARGNEFYATSDFAAYQKILYPLEDGSYGTPEDTQTKPLYMEVLGPYFYHTKNDRLYLSKDGLCWKQVEGVREKVTEVNLAGEKLLVNGKKLVDLPDFGRPYTLMLNDTRFSLEGITTIVNDRTVIPVRLLSELLGAKVDWNNDTRTVIITYHGDTISFPIDLCEVTVNGVTQSTDAPAVIYQDRTMLPLRSFAQYMSFRFDYNEQTNFISMQEALRPIDLTQAYPDPVLPAKGIIRDEAAAKEMAQVLYTQLYGPAALDGYRVDVFYNQSTQCFEITMTNGDNSNRQHKIILRKLDGAVISME